MSEVTFTGRVITGSGSCAGDVTGGVYEQVGELFPGSLNLRVDPVPDLGPADVRVEWPSGDRLLWAATVDGVGCHILWAPHFRGTVELLAPVRLRDALDLVDGDTVDVRVDRPGRQRKNGG